MTVLWSRIVTAWRWFSRPTPPLAAGLPLSQGLDVVEYPKIAVYRTVPIPCRLCGDPIRDGELVVWFERRDGQRSDLAHGECAIFVRKEDGTVVHPSGTEVELWAAGAGTLLLTVREWASWVAGQRQENR